MAKAKKKKAKTARAHCQRPNGTLKKGWKWGKGGGKRCVKATGGKAAKKAAKPRKRKSGASSTPYYSGGDYAKRAEAFHLERRYGDIKHDYPEQMDGARRRRRRRTRR